MLASMGNEDISGEHDDKIYGTNDDEDDDDGANENVDEVN